MPITSRPLVGLHRTTSVSAIGRAWQVTVATDEQNSASQRQRQSHSFAAAASAAWRNSSAAGGSLVNDQERLGWCRGRTGGFGGSGSSVATDEIASRQRSLERRKTVVFIDDGSIHTSENDGNNAFTSIIGDERPPSDGLPSFGSRGRLNVLAGRLGGRKWTPLQSLAAGVACIANLEDGFTICEGVKATRHLSLQ